MVLTCFLFQPAGNFGESSSRPAREQCQRRGAKARRRKDLFVGLKIGKGKFHRDHVAGLKRGHRFRLLASRPVAGVKL